MPTALYLTIADHLREQIRTGDLAVGDVMPSESQLREQWGTSRGPVRQALASLRAEGLIAGGPGRPPVVRTASLAQPFDTLLSYSAWAAALGRRPGQRTLELARRPADPEAAARVGVEEGSPVVQVLRLRLLDGQPAMLERAVFVEPVGRLLFAFDCDSGSIWAYLQSRGVRFATARHVIDAVAAGADDARHLAIAQGSPLLRQQRTTFDPRGEVIEYHDDRYLPDKVSFTLENALDVRTPFTRELARKLARDLTDDEGDPT